MKVLKAQLLGGFSMYYGERPILLNKMESSKAARLLQILLAAAPDGIVKNELIDNLYGWEENSDAVNRKRSLNNVVYRLKSVLSAAGLPGESFVETIDGVCRFAPWIPLETDAARFMALVERADAAASLSDASAQTTDISAAVREAGDLPAAVSADKVVTGG